RSFPPKPWTSSLVPPPFPSGLERASPAVIEPGPERSTHEARCPSFPLPPKVPPGKAPQDPCPRRVGLGKDAPCPFPPAPRHDRHRGRYGPLRRRLRHRLPSRRR